jgi:hypothetical protein
MNLDRLYRVANELQIADQEVVSETRLYGVRENLWVSAMTGLYPNYAGAWTAHESNFGRSRDAGAQGNGTLHQTTGVAAPHTPAEFDRTKQPNGKKKFRPIRDAGAKRQPRARLLHKMVKRVSRVKRMRALKQQVRETAASAHLTERATQAETISVVDQTAQLVREASELLAEQASALLVQQASSVITERATDLLSQLSSFAGQSVEPPQSYQPKPEAIALAIQSAQILIDQHKSGETAERSYLARRSYSCINL